MVMRSVVLGALALGALLAAPAHAQEQDASSVGLSATAAFAAGSSKLSCANCDGVRAWAPSGYLRVGRVVAPGLVVSGEVDLWRKSEEWSLFFEGTGPANGTSQFTITTVGALAQWYPLPAHGFFVDAGIGIGRYSVSSRSRDVGGFAAHSNALGYQAGAGYDIPLTTHVSLTPSAKVFGFTKTRFEGADGKVSANVAQIAIGLTLH